MHARRLLLLSRLRRVLKTLRLLRLGFGFRSRSEDSGSEACHSNLFEPPAFVLVGLVGALLHPFHRGPPTCFRFSQSCRLTHSGLPLNLEFRLSAVQLALVFFHLPGSSAQHFFHSGQGQLATASVGHLPLPFESSRENLRALPPIPSTATCRPRRLLGDKARASVSILVAALTCLRTTKMTRVRLNVYRLTDFAAPGLCSCCAAYHTGQLKLNEEQFLFLNQSSNVSVSSSLLLFMGSYFRRQ